MGSHVKLLELIQLALVLHSLGKDRIVNHLSFYTFLPYKYFQVTEFIFCF